MADVTPTTAIPNSQVVLTWGSNTYHGITNWRRQGSIESAIVRFSTSSGIDRIRIPGGQDASFVLDILVGAGDDTTTAAFKEGTEQTTCELHPEGDSAGNIELIFDDGGFVQSNDMGGSPGEAMIMSVTIVSIGDTTIQAAV